MSPHDTDPHTSSNRPLPLAKGDPVAVVCPAGRVVREQLEAGLNRLSERFTPIPPDDLPADGYLAADDDSRLAAVQNALDSPGVLAVLAARGGYGTTRILDRLRFDGLLEHPKWLVGCSDLTALLMDLWVKHRYQTVHGPMVAGFHKTAEQDVERLFDLLTGAAWPGCRGLTKVAPGEAQGPLVGGNLFVLAHLCGTLSLSAEDLEGAVLFLEEVGEAPYRIDRCLVQLERCGVFDAVAGVVIGETTGCRKGPDGTSAAEVFVRQFGGFDRPVAKGYPAAHGDRNLPFIHGGDVRLVVREEGAILEGKG